MRMNSNQFVVVVAVELVVDVEIVTVVVVVDYMKLNFITLIIPFKLTFLSNWFSGTLKRLNISVLVRCNL